MHKPRAQKWLPWNFFAFAMRWNKGLYCNDNKLNKSFLREFSVLLTLMFTLICIFLGIERNSKTFKFSWNLPLFHSNRYCPTLRPIYKPQLKRPASLQSEFAFLFPLGWYYDEPCEIVHFFTSSLFASRRSR